MALPPLRRCSFPLCRELVREQARCPKHPHKRAKRTQTTTEQGYGHYWGLASKAYRLANPLCVPCLFAGRIHAVEAVDHIAPRACLIEQQWSTENYCSTCLACHNRKGAIEPKQVWIAGPDRVVICGLPGTGKSTAALATGAPVFDADALGLTTPEQVQRARQQWIANHPTGPVAIIVSHPFPASQVAYQARARIMHLTCDETERQKRLQIRGETAATTATADPPGVVLFAVSRGDERAMGERKT